MGEVIATVKTIGKFSKVAMHVFGVGKRTIGARESRFQVAQRRIDPAKFGGFDRLRTSVYDIALVRGVGNRCDRCKAPEIFGDHVRAGCQRMSCSISERGFSEARHWRQAIKCGLPLRPVCTAAANGTLLGELRPGFPPTGSKPR